MNFQSHQNFIPKKAGRSEIKGNVLNMLFVAFRVLPFVLLSAFGVLLVIAAAAVISVFPYVAELKTAYASVLSGQSDLVAAEAALRTQDFKSAKNLFESASADFSDVENRLTEVGKSTVFKTPGIKKQFVIALDFASAGRDLSIALGDLSGVGNDILTAVGENNLTFSKITPEQKQRALKMLMQSEQTFLDAKSKIDSAGLKIEEINNLQPLFVFQDAQNTLNENYPKLKSLIDAALVATDLTPALAGYPDEKNYLLLLLNNRELRPGGGFIGTYGVLKIKDAEIKTFLTDNIYNFDVLAEPFWTEKPPEPIVQYLKQSKWFLRDSNWWPDFPESSKKALAFYRGEGGKENFDGVIGITPDVMQDILAVIGPLTVDGITFNSENFWDRLEYEVEYGYASKDKEFSERKDIIGDLGKLLMAKLYALPVEKWPEMFDLVKTNVVEKQLMAYFVEPKMQSVALKTGFAGEMKSFSGDYILIADANLAALKTDSVMNRTLVYSVVENEKGELIATAKMNYQNIGNFSWKTSRYRTYTRLYAPKGSELIEVLIEGQKTDKAELRKEFDKTVFGLFFEVEPQTAKEISWKYKLPDDIAQELRRGEYNLLVQKQPGLPKLNLQLDLQFQKSIIEKENIKFDVSDGHVKHAEELRQDQSFSVRME